MILAKKSLGQHWLRDEAALRHIVQAANPKVDDIVLEIGPGPGTLTRLLVTKAKQVIAVELDHNLALQLPQRLPAKNLKVVEGDILKFDFTKLSKNYKVVANIPYYLTAKLLRTITETTNPPKLVVLLVQKEVAERICAGPGRMSLLSLSIQLKYETSLGQILPAKLFIPPPKVDSQVVILKRRRQPRFKGLDERIFFQVAKAGFSQRRKKLRSSLSAGLQLSKGQVDELLDSADVNGDLRAESLTLEQWYKLYTHYQLKKDPSALLRPHKIRIR
jgi:16S rRNA (adenine1518-N6/adenine1519-N6)-dimethyltransferase